MDISSAMTSLRTRWFNAFVWQLPRFPIVKRSVAGGTYTGCGICWRFAPQSEFWQQDNVIAVRERLEVPGFVGWSQKAGVWQVQPPVEVLAQMIAVRVHLDDCGADNGPLRVLPGSHRCGWLDDDLDAWKAGVPEMVCTVKCGGILVMCPLLLHASAASESAGHRRVIHIEYAAADLPAGLDWNIRIAPTPMPAGDVVEPLVALDRG